MRPLAVLRPEPGNAATCARIMAAGGTAIALPLFAIRAIAWTPPAADRFDALVLTSANAVRHAGPALLAYRDLPLFAVGAATADAARDAGLAVVAIGTGNAIELTELANARGVRRALHLAGRDRAKVDLPGIAETISVYASEPCDPDPERLAELAGAVALIHSPRAGVRLAAVRADQAAVRIVAISAAALAAAGPGWATSRIADRPDDESLIAAGLALAD